jgi:hypothetical protein
MARPRDRSRGGLLAVSGLKIAICDVIIVKLAVKKVCEAVTSTPQTLKWPKFRILMPSTLPQEARL